MARTVDHASSEVVDRHRVAHIEDENLAALADRTSLDDELYRFGNRHEVSSDRAIGDRHGPSASDLLLEHAENAAARTEYVAEPHSG